MTIQLNFGNKVKELRLSKGWTQERLAEEVGTHRTYMSGIERGERNPTLMIIERIAKALGVPAAVLFDQEEKCAYTQRQKSL